ncbi:MAG TPA: ribosomal-processing cysteine protease Prp, partial [Spirochaetota bacterium]|nr:ribosomal-processing cysteine protease Prp [Spirochaetota bacterium]
NSIFSTNIIQKMIRIVISRDSTGSIRSFDIKGHSGYAEAGQDIICSAVSVYFLYSLEPYPAALP